LTLDGSARDALRADRRSDVAHSITVLEGTLRAMPCSVIVASILIALTTLVLPFSINRIYDRVVPQDAVGTLLLLTGLLIGCSVIELALRTARGYLLARMAVLGGWRHTKRCLDHVASSPSGDLGPGQRSRLLELLQTRSALTDLAAAPARLFVVELTVVPVFFILLALTTGPLALVPLAVCCGSVVLVVRGARRFREAVERRNAAETALRRFQEERLGSPAAVRGLGLRLATELEHVRLQERAIACGREVALKQDELQGFAQTIGTVAQVSTIFVGGMMAVGGSLTPGVLVCSSILAIRMAQPFSRLAIAWQDVQSELALRGMEGWFGPGNPSRASPVAPTAGAPDAVELRSASVAYAAGQGLAARAIDLSIAPGECIAIVGADASAKLAVLRSIAGESLPVSGDVLVGGRPSVDRSKAGPGAIAFVRERPLLLRGSILTNITLHRPWVSGERAIGAARLVGLEREVMRLPQGFETAIAGGPVQDLSAGLAKRIGLARACAGTPRVLVACEPQAGLDVLGRIQVGQLLRQLKGRCTVVFSTNAPELVAIADRTLHLKDGALVPVRLTTQPPSAPSPLHLEKGA
jgi:ATP-binding cassette subfamily C protein LapB